MLYFLSLSYVVRQSNYLQRATYELSLVCASQGVIVGGTMSVYLFMKGVGSLRTYLFARPRKASLCVIKLG